MSLRSIDRASAQRKSNRHLKDERNLRRFAGRVYVASPLATFGTVRYDAMLSRVQELIPDAELIPARGLFTSNADWRDRWPAVLPTLGAVVFFDDEDGCIGAGTEQEITDALLAGVPVFFMPSPPFNTLIPCDASGKVEFWPVVGHGMRQTQRVCYAVPATEFLSMKGGG